MALKRGFLTSETLAGPNKETLRCRQFLYVFSTWNRPAWSWTSGRMDQSPDSFILSLEAAWPVHHAGRSGTHCEWPSVTEPEMFVCYPNRSYALGFVYALRCCIIMEKLSLTDAKLTDGLHRVEGFYKPILGVRDLFINIEEGESVQMLERLSGTCLLRFCWLTVSGVSQTAQEAYWL